MKFSFYSQGAIAKLQSSSLHALYQLCSALRVLSKILMSDYDLKKIISENLKQSNGERRSSKTKELLHLALESSTDFDVQVVQAGSHLIRSAEISIDQIEVQFSIIRTLSVLSEHDSCCNAISDMSPRLGILLGPILIALPNQKHNQQNNSTEAMSTATAFMSNKSLGLLNRIGYILGNIMSKSDSARQCFYNNDVALEYLLKTLEYYANDELMFKRIKSALINDDIRCDADEITATTNECQIDTVIDVVIKLIRVVANLSVNAEVGYKLANFHQLGTILLTILNTINKYHMNFVRIRIIVGKILANIQLTLLFISSRFAIRSTIKFSFCLSGFLFGFLSVSTDIGIRRIAISHTGRHS